jgi:hypothetical protein
VKSAEQTEPESRYFVPRELLVEAFTHFPRLTQHASDVTSTPSWIRTSNLEPKDRPKAPLDRTLLQRESSPTVVPHPTARDHDTT